MIIIGAGARLNYALDILENTDNIKTFNLNYDNFDESILENIKKEKIFIALKNYQQIEKIISIKNFKLSNLTNIFHTNSQLSKNIKLGKNNLFNVNCVVNNNTTIGNFCMFNSSCVVEHDCIIMNYVTISPNATILGNCKIDDHTFIGSGSVIKEGVSIGKNCIIGANSFINNNIEDNSKVFGNPGRVI